MEERTAIGTREETGQALEGAAKTAIPDTSSICPAQPEATAANKAPAIRKELLDKLLDRKVTFEEIKKHGLSNTEIEYLYMGDIVIKREYLEVIKIRGRSRRTAYRMWWKAARKSLKNFDYKPFAVTISALKQDGPNAEAERLKAWLDMRCAGGIPAHEMFSTVRDYVVELLGLVRDELYNKDTFGTNKVAEMLEVSPRHVRRLAQEGTLRKEGRGLFSKKLVEDYMRQQALRKINACIDLHERLVEYKDSRGYEFLGESLERYLELERLITSLPKMTNDTNNGPDVVLE
jgi:hypothetical protein